jgi:hypothetical protein
MKNVFKLVKRIIYNFLLIYSFNIVLQPLNINIPLNFITVGVVALFGISAFLSLITMLLLFF